MARQKIKHPEVWVSLEGTDDRMTIIGRVTHKMRQSAVPTEEVEHFREEAHREGKDLDTLLAICESWVRVTR